MSTTGQSSTGAPGTALPVSVHQAELDGLADPCSVQRVLRRPGAAALLLDGGEFPEAWQQGPLVALEPDLLQTATRSLESRPALRAVERLVARRRAAGGTAETGLAVLLGYEWFEPDSSGDAGFPQIVVLSVDRSLRFGPAGKALLTIRGERGPNVSARDLQIWSDRVASLDVSVERGPAADAAGAIRTSLPRQDYLQAVSRVQQQIRRGDIYQANLTQRFDLEYKGDPFELFARETSSLTAPHSAYLETGRLALASVSPETFLRMRVPGRLETRPIKGTRPRGTSPGTDRAAARELLESSKDHAELLMIVDLERNDLSRVCSAGSVEVGQLAELRSYPTVHHLVASVTGTLKQGTGIADLIEATFPGGSITGAPKLRAMQILRELEPVPRNFFTGSLLWFGDDGTLDSSILIRTLVFGKDRVHLGAGGGVVADSEPEAEWEESNHKASGLAAALGFDPREAR